MPREEKKEWVSQARRLLQQEGKKGTQKEIAEGLGMSESWVKKYDPIEHQEQDHSKGSQHNPFYGYNVWGFRDESWRWVRDGKIRPIEFDNQRFFHINELQRLKEQRASE